MQTSTLPHQLPMARYRFHWLVERDINLPDYSGSTLRGVFGIALRHLACMTKQPTCTDCPLLRTCPYPSIFETPPPPEGDHALQKFSQAPNPYMIEPPAWGQRCYEPNTILAFDLVLVGQAIHQLPLIIYAWQSAFERGLGKGDGTAQLLAVEHLPAQGQALTIFSPIKQITQVQPHQASIDWHHLIQDQPHQSVTLHVTTPLRLQENGHALPPNKLTASKLLMALVRRTSLLLEFHSTDYQSPSSEVFSQLAEWAKQIDSHTDGLTWLDWQRYSNRQQRSMALGGVVGEWTLSGDLSPFLPYLILGQWLHVGKNGSFGLGKYHL